MGKVYQSLEQIIDLFPKETNVYKTSGESNTPCCFCQTGNPVIYNGFTFHGEDRLVWFATGTGTYCRQCGFHSYQSILDLIDPGATLSEELVVNFSITREPTQLTLHNTYFVDWLHNQVKREYWYRLGWTDDIIDKFRLGFGPMYPNSTKQPRHIIPFHPWTVYGVEDGWALEGRLNSRSDELMPDEPYNKKTVGLSGNRYFALIEESQEDKRIAIVEGPKDAISAYVLGFKNIAVSFGTTAWTEPKMKFLAEQGYKQVFSCGDNDEAGQKFNQDNAMMCQGLNLECFWFVHPEEHRAIDGADLTDFLAEKARWNLTISFQLGTPPRPLSFNEVLMQIIGS